MTDSLKEAVDLLLDHESWCNIYTRLSAPDCNCEEDRNKRIDKLLTLIAERELKLLERMEEIMQPQKGLHNDDDFYCIDEKAFLDLKSEIKGEEG